MMDRRRFLLASASAGFAAPAALAQTGAKLPIVGFVGLADRESHKLDISGFRQGLQEQGHVEGRTILVDERYAESAAERYSELIADMLRREIAVFVTPGPAAARAIRRRTTKIPIVVVALPSSNRFPDLFASLAQPGGNVTGFSHIGSDLAPKRVEILKEAVPSIGTIAVLHATTDPIYEEWAAETESTARDQGLKTIRLSLSSPSAEPLAELMQSARAAGATGLIIVRDFITDTLRADIVRAANAARMAAVSEHRSFAEAGALLSYGANLPNLFRRAAAYVDRILKGANPGELPIQLPTKFELVVNLKTASALGLAIPPTLLARADEVGGGRSSRDLRGRRSRSRSPRARRRATAFVGSACWWACPKMTPE